jgi:predicted GTPase
MADVFVVNKIDSAPPSDVELLEQELRAVNGRAMIGRTASPIHLDDPSAVKGKRVLVVEDGPTITHGGMPYGAGYLAAVAAGADVIDPRLSAAPEIRKIFEAYPHIGKVLPAIGYDASQLAALRTTINESAADAVVSATPIDLAQLIQLRKRVVRARYEFAETGDPKLSSIIEVFVARAVPPRSEH